MSRHFRFRVIDIMALLTFAAILAFSFRMANQSEVMTQGIFDLIESQVHTENIDDIQSTRIWNLGTKLKEKCERYETRIIQLQIHVEDLEKRVDKLEKEVSDGPKS